MNKHDSDTQSSVINDIRRLSPEELIELYGIDIGENGTVFDPTENQHFATLEQWAEYIAQQEDDNNYGTFIKRNGKGRFDDEY
jgi:hypothetical protein